jgi:hypothetical protein
MPRSSYWALVDRGRKAGLSTGELYPALASRPPETGHRSGRPCPPDGNGFVVELDADGHPVCRPSLAGRSS